MAKQTGSASIYLAVSCFLFFSARDAVATQILAKASYYNLDVTQDGPSGQEYSYELSGGNKLEISFNSGRWYAAQFHSFTIGILFALAKIDDAPQGDQILPDGTAVTSTSTMELDHKGLGAHLHWRLSSGQSKSKNLGGTFLELNGGGTLYESKLDSDFGVNGNKRRFRFKTQSLKAGLAIGYSWDSVDLFFSKDFEYLKFTEASDRDQVGLTFGALTAIRDTYTVGIALLIEGGSYARTSM